MINNKVDYIQKDKILRDIFEQNMSSNKYVTEKELLDSVHNAMIVATKPFGTFHYEFISNVLEQIQRHGYIVCEYSVLDCSDILQRGIFKKQYKYLFQIANYGESLFTDADYENIASIYGAKKYKIIPSYDLISDYGCSKEEIAHLWKNGYAKIGNLQDKSKGINKIGLYKYVLQVQDDSINNGIPFLLLNGLAIELEETYRIKNEKVCIFVIMNTGTESTSWKDMREKCIGDKAFPMACDHESIRYKAYAEKIKLSQKVDYWNNVIHMSSSLLESLHDEMIWFNRNLEDTIVGKMLLKRGFSQVDIMNFLEDPVFKINGKMCTLYHWIDKKESKEAMNLLEKYIIMK